MAWSCPTERRQLGAQGRSGHGDPAFTPAFTRATRPGRTLRRMADDTTAATTPSPFVEAANGVTTPIQQVAEQPLS